MATLAESLVSSSSRVVRLRMRPDLTARRHRYQGRSYWVVKEPIGLNYFRFHEEEYAILQMLDGQVSLDEIKDRFEDEFTPQKITLQDLQQFVGMLHRSGLVISDLPGQGRQLKKRADERWRRELWGKLSNIFSLRFRGIDPERLLNWLYRYTYWFFSWWFLCVWSAVGLSALLLVATQFETFHNRLPAFHEFFAAKNWIWLGITMAVVKVLHEFGHGLSCKHFGGECHELGFMLLVFTPALYCNVSDSWMLPNKYARAAIGAAGMYVEVFLASIATFLWWFSEPGLFNHVCLSVMFICSVSTVVFNGNPLLRFDGYYILMDLAEIPNLRQKSTEVVRRFFVWLCLGIEQPESPFLPQSNHLLFGLYTVAAVIYRWLVVFSIMYFLSQVFEPIGLKIVGQAIALAGLVGLVVQPAYQLFKFFYTPGRMHKVKKPRMYATAAVVVGLIGFVGFVPLPHHIVCSLEVAPLDAEHVYVEVPGKMAQPLVEIGQSVTSGTLLAKLSNSDLYRELEELQGQLNEAETEFENLRELRRVDPSVGVQIRPQGEAVQTMREMLRERKERVARLELIAPIAGTVLPPPAKNDRKGPEGRLSGWTGSPFDLKNRGAHLSAGELLCLIGDPRKVEGVLVVDQSDVDLIRLGDEVEIKLDSYPTRTFTTKIKQIANDELEISPPSLSIQHGGELDTRTDETGMQRPLHTSFQARTEPLEVDEQLIQLGMRGRAKVSAQWQTIGWRIYRFAVRTFHFDL